MRGEPNVLKFIQRQYTHQRIGRGSQALRDGYDFVESDRSRAR